MYFSKPNSDRPGFTQHHFSLLKVQQRVQQKNGAGFTLIELLISIAIVGILSAMMFSNFSKEKDRNALKGFVQQLQTDLQGAQINAQGGVQTTGVTSLLGYGISLNGSGYTVFAGQNITARYDTPLSPTLPDIITRTVNIPTGTGVLISKFDGINSTGTVIGGSRLDVQYLTPNGSAKIAYNNGFTDFNSAIIYINSTKLNVCYAITVTAGVGTISQKQLASSC